MGEKRGVREGRTLNIYESSGANFHLFTMKILQRRQFHKRINKNDDINFDIA